MKKKLSLLLTLLLCLGLIPKANASSSPFGDIPTSHWAYDAIVEAYNDGVMTGTASGVFSPSGKLNMAQFITVLTRAFYNEDVLNCTVAGAWPNQNYDVAEKHNLVTGLKRYASEVEVTRENMAQMMYNVMVDKDVILPNDTEIQAIMNTIPDLTSVDSNYRTAVATCYYLDLLSGVDASGTFAPRGVLNRAQTAVIYTRLKKVLNALGTGSPGIAAPGTIQNPTGATLTNGMPITEENVLALIEEYRNGKEPGEKAKAAGFTSYVDGSYYDAYNPSYSTRLSDGSHSGTECAKFAFAFWDDIFGSDAPVREVTNPADVRPGDLLWSGTHWSVATMRAFDYKERGPHTQEVGGGPSGTIGWTSGGYSNISPIKKIYTRYPE